LVGDSLQRVVSASSGGELEGGSIIGTDDIDGTISSVPAIEISSANR